jgi:hypothetical protein
MLAAPGCKKSSAFDFNITGSWVINMTDNQGNQTTNTFIFSGNLQQGTVTIQNINSTGSFTVDGDRVEFSVSYGFAAPLYWENFTGTFRSDDSMSGDFNVTLDGNINRTGTWHASR